MVEKNPSANALMQLLPDYCNGVYDRTIIAASSSRSLRAKKRRHVVVLGAGMCARPAVEYLSRERATKVASLSDFLADACILADL